MPYVWLEHLNERQKNDYSVILGDIVLQREKIEEFEEIDTAISKSRDSDTQGFNYQPLPTGDTDPNTRVEPYSGKMWLLRFIRPVG